MKTNKNKNKDYFGNILKLLIKLKIKRFTSLISSMVLRDPVDLSRQLVSLLIPEKRKDLILKAERNFDDLTVAELIHVSYSLGDDPVERLSGIFPLVHPKGFISADAKIFYSLYQYKPTKEKISQTRGFLEKQLSIVNKIEKQIKNLKLGKK